MKKMFALAVMLTAALTLSAQGPRGRGGNPNKGEDKKEWMEKIQNEKIAFFTTELDLTPEEAQIFWPVYNELEKLRLANHEAEFMAVRSMKTALEKGTGNIDEMLAQYAEAKKSGVEIEVQAHERLGKVLSAEKLARLYVTEEKFRRHQFNRIGEGPKERP